MQDAYSHCEALVREADHDRFIAALFVPADRRRHLHALYAFDVELKRVGHVVREALAGEIRLQWWRDALAGEARGDAMANPVAAALIDTVTRCDLPVDAFNALIDARAHDLYGEPFVTFGELEAHAQRAESTQFGLAARILDREGSAGEAPAPAGIATALARALQDLPREAARGRIGVPLDVLDRHAVDRDSIRAGTTTAPLAATLAELARKGRDRLDEVRRDWAGVSPQARAAFLPLAVTDLLLARAERNSNPFRPAGIAPWRRQWRIWRAARRGRL